MSLVRESDAYRAYYNLCIYLGRKPLRKSKWRKQNCIPINQSKTVEEIRNELDAFRTT